MTKSAIIPITNVHAKGDYTASVKLGSQKTPLNLILDTGSSTFVVRKEKFSADADASVSSTRQAQYLRYGEGGWLGPVLKTQVQMGERLHKIAIDDVNFALTEEEHNACFGYADGILGLAYKALNPAHDLTEYLHEERVFPPVTYPWPPELQKSFDDLNQLGQFLRRFPREHLTPYFTQLEEQGLTANQFGFIVHRSSIYHTHQSATPETLAKHPLNNGFFILGNPKKHTHLYAGDFAKVKVLHDKYYNVNLLKLKIGETAFTDVPKLAEKHLSTCISNAIIDSGAGKNMLPTTLFSWLIDGLCQYNSAFSSLLEPFKVFDGKEKGIPLDDIDLSEWPDISLILEGFDGQHVELIIKPSTYWQTHAPEPNQATFQFFTLPSWPNQSVLGLPLINNYYTIFDRADHAEGAVLFGEKSFAPHTFLDSFHRNKEKLLSLFVAHGHDTDSMHD